MLDDQIYNVNLAIADAKRIVDFDSRNNQI